MKILKYLLIVPLFFLFFYINTSSAEQNLEVYFFYGDGCPHCAKEEIFLKKIEKKYNNLKINRYEVWHNQENSKLLFNIASKLSIEITGVPVLVIGNEAVTGYFNDATTGAKIENIINKFLEEGCSDTGIPIIINDQINQQCLGECATDGHQCLEDCGCQTGIQQEKKEIPESVNIPFFGEVKIKNVSLPILTLLIAGTDGFNPCAMWILLFLGFVYWIRILIGLVALGSGGYHLYDAYKNREGGCEVTGTEKRQRMFNRLKNITHKKSFWLAFVGIVALAVAVNLVELVCSAGLPAVYTQILALAELPTWQYYSYLLFYIFIFMLDDMVIFLVAMTTLQMKALSSKYTRYAGLIGGIIMLIVGILLIFKPGWLMFG